MLGQLFFYFIVFREFCQVFPFELVVVMVVEFFGAVGVADVAESFGPEGVVVSAKGGQGGCVPGCVWVFEQGE